MSFTQKCAGQVFRNYHFRPCINKGKAERDGHWFCGIHDPVSIKAKEEARNARWQAQRNADTARWKEASRLRSRAELCVAACEGLTDGDVKRLTALNRCDIMAFIAQNL